MEQEEARYRAFARRTDPFLTDPFLTDPFLTDPFLTDPFLTEQLLAEAYPPLDVTAWPKKHHLQGG